MAIWAIYDSNYIPICDWDAILSVDAEEAGRVPVEPQENGALAAYNKSAEPARVTVTIAMSSGNIKQILALLRLLKLKNGTGLCTILTPTWIWRKMALERYGYSRAAGAGATLLAVDLGFVEVRSVQVSTTTYSPQNATSASVVSTGKTQTASSVSSAKASTAAYKASGYSS